MNMAVREGSVSNKVPAIDAAYHEIMKELFKDLRSIYSGWRATWKTQEEYNTAIETWKLGFFENNIKAESVDHALVRARKDPSNFPPSVGLFVSWCKPSLDSCGLPSVDDAWSEVIKTACTQGHVYSHLAIKQAVTDAGGKRAFVNKDERRVFKVFERCYLKVCEEVMSGRDLEVTLIEKKEPDQNLAMYRDLKKRSESDAADFLKILKDSKITIDLSEFE